MKKFFFGDNFLQFSIKYMLWLLICCGYSLEAPFFLLRIGPFQKGDKTVLTKMPCLKVEATRFVCVGFTAQSTQWGHVEHGQFT